MAERPIGGRYTLERKVGSGGMGAIWVALDEQLQRRVALKLMEAQRVASAGALQRFAQEARAVARLHHPHVVQLHDYGVDGEVPYLVMELLEGEDLEALLARRERLAPSALLPLVQQVARALTAAHAAGIIHRDLKPANLFLARVDGEQVLKVVDFGLALLGADGGQGVHNEDLAGTPRYMSPEQLRGEALLDPRSDLWSLGVVLYRALTGHFPFSADVLEAMHGGSAPLAPPRPSSLVPELGEALDGFCLRALEPDPARRFQSARELALAFAAAAAPLKVRQAPKVLVVDDEPDMEELVRQRFRKQVRAGLYQFIFARDGEDALEKLRQHPDTDAVVSDINMPRMDGLTFLARVGEVNPLVKVIIVSAYSDVSNIRTAMNRGAFDFLVKPLDFQDLEVTLDKTLKLVGELRQAVRSTEENDLLRMFVSGGMVERVLSAVRTPEGMAGEQVEATVVFIDVKGFTQVARTQPPEVALRRLNANFEVIVPEVASRGGVVDKFLGDAVMAVFRGQGHLGRALEASLSVRQHLRALALRGGEHSAYTHGTCIGVASGEVLCGGVGARALGRLDYTVLGEVVNRAARLALVAGREQILIDGPLRNRLDAGFECTALGPRVLPGEAEAVALYDVVQRGDVVLTPLESTASALERELSQTAESALAARQG